MRQAYVQTLVSSDYTFCKVYCAKISLFIHIYLYVLFIIMGVTCSRHEN